MALLDRGAASAWDSARRSGYLGPGIFHPVLSGSGPDRYRGIAWDNGAIWQIVGNDCKRYADYRPGLVKYHASTGKVLDTVDFVPGSCDPHGLVMHNGSLVSCDAGIHPGWPNNDSPNTGFGVSGSTLYRSHSARTQLKECGRRRAKRSQSSAHQDR